MIYRDMTDELLRSATEYPVVTVLGPRQSGKTTLVRSGFPGKPYVSLESPDVRASAASDPRTFLGRLAGGAILDEVQRVPDLLSYLQGMVDDEDEPGRFILTGSHGPSLHEKVSQSLAGRTAVLTLWPLSLAEMRRFGADPHPFDLIHHGFFPRLHARRLSPRSFYNGYLQTYVERDLRSMVQVRNLTQFQRFLTLIAGRVGGLVNLSSLGSDAGISTTTVRTWLSVLMASYLVFELTPWFENVGRRVVKSPKLYFTDVGLAAYLLGIETPDQAARDPLRGQLYENLVVAEVAKGALNAGIRPSLHFFRDSNGNEVDLIIRHGGRLIPIEIKSGATFSADFLKGLQRFAALDLPGTAPGFVLHDRAMGLTAHGTRTLDPLRATCLWECLVA